jgi:hypothetical protein
LVPTEGFAIENLCPFAVKGLTPTPGLEKDHAGPSLERKKRRSRRVNPVRKFGRGLDFRETFYEVHLL